MQINWVDNLQGDFSFTDRWSYGDYVHRNDYGQLVCDGICDEAIFAMLDSDGRILTDSLDRYYQLVDTTRYYHSIASEAACYEWAGTDFIHAYRFDGDTVVCYSECNAGTHSSLHLVLAGDQCLPQIVLNSVASVGLDYFACTGGSIQLDRTFWEKGILKAEFDFTFADSYGRIDPMYWKGNIMTPIVPKPSNTDNPVWWMGKHFGNRMVYCE